MTMAPATKKASANFRAAFRPRLSLRNPPPADPTAAPRTAELTIKPCIQCSLRHVFTIYWPLWVGVNYLHC